MLLVEVGRLWDAYEALPFTVRGSNAARTAAGASHGSPVKKGRDTGTGVSSAMVSRSIFDICIGASWLFYGRCHALNPGTSHPLERV